MRYLYTLLFTVLCTQILAQDIFKGKQTENKYTEEVEFHLVFVHNGMEYETDGMVSMAEPFSEIAKTEYADWGIPLDAITAVKVEFANGMNSTELIAYCIKEDGHLIVYGKESTYPNWDEEVFIFMQRLVI